MIPVPFDAIWAGACSLLPASLNSDGARAMVIAIGLQESRFKYRRQINGPARSFWQFEFGGGVRGVLNHPGTGPLIRSALDALAYDHEPATSYAAMEHNDVLACCYARLLLSTVPGKLPESHEPSKGWEQYLAGWRPGKPHPDTWDEFYEQAWQLTQGASP